MRKGLSRPGERGVAKRAALPVLLLSALTGYAGPQAPARQDRDAEPFRISVDVALVVLQATVTDRRGGFVSNLGESNFGVYENGVAQSIRLFRSIWYAKTTTRSVRQSASGSGSSGRSSGRRRSAA